MLYHVNHQVTLYPICQKAATAPGVVSFRGILSKGTVIDPPLQLKFATCRTTRGLCEPCAWRSNFVDWGHFCSFRQVQVARCLFRLQLILGPALLGPYASAILRFQIRFPDIYPDLPPLVTFATDVFHPLIVPLTTYTFSTSSASDNPVSATDEERLPPGGFSLRHGFPHWFGRAKRSELASGQSSRNASGEITGNEIRENTKSSASSTGHDVSGAPEATETEEVADSTESPRIAQVPSGLQFAEARKTVPVAELLDYIRSTFDDETVLDSLPVEVAGNPGAWHAWKAHRRGADSSRDWKKGSPQARQPGDWHWDGIWARRVHDEIDASHSDPMLFGGATRGGGDEMVNMILFTLSPRR